MLERILREQPAARVLRSVSFNHVGGPVHTAIRQLIQCAHDDLLPHVRDAIVRHGADAIEPLLALLHDEQHRCSRLHYHVLELLADVGDERVAREILPLLHDDQEGDRDYYAYTSLLALGPASIAPLLEVVWADCDAYGTILAEIAQEYPDPRVTRLVCHLLTSDPVAGAECAILLGDTALVPNLVQAARDSGMHPALMGALDHFGVTLLAPHAPTVERRMGLRSAIWSQ